MVIWLWLIARMVVIGVGAYCAGRSVEAYTNLHKALSPQVPESLYSFLGEDDARGIAIAGYTLAALAILLAFLQERAMAANAVHDETETLYWVEEMYESAGPKLATVMRPDVADRESELQEYQSFLLRAAARAWGGQGNTSDVRLAYFRLDSRSSDSSAQYQVGYPAHSLSKINADVNFPLNYQTGTRRLGRFWGTTAEFSFARKSAIQIPVRSPLSPQANPIGLVLGESPKRNTFKGEGRRVGASCLAQWLAAGELAVRPGLRPW